MSEVCNPLVCDQSEIPVESLFRENLAYWIPDDDVILSEDGFPIDAETGDPIENIGAAAFKQPVIRASLGNEDVLRAEDGTPILSQGDHAIFSDDFFSCFDEITTRTLAKMLFNYDKKIRVVEASEAFSEMDCNTLLSTDALFRMAITKNDEGCTALRILIFNNYDSFLTCDDEMNPIQRMRTAFYINSDGTQTALGVVLNGFEAEGFFTCNDNSGGMGLLEIIGRLFILKFENNYLASLSYSEDSSEGYLRNEDTGYSILGEDSEKILT